MLILINRSFCIFTWIIMSANKLRTTLIISADGRQPTPRRSPMFCAVAAAVTVAVATVAAIRALIDAECDPLIRPQRDKETLHCPNTEHCVAQAALALAL